jgi:hypothetical protein
MSGISEDVARSKWCPFARVVPAILDGARMHPAAGNPPAHNRVQEIGGETTEATTHAAHNCLASKCKVGGRIRAEPKHGSRAWIARELKALGLLGPRGRIGKGLSLRLATRLIDMLNETDYSRSDV